MRISADPDDPGYANYITHRRARVFLDGIERDGVFTADEEKRFVIMAVRDERGNLKVKDDMIVREKWTGNVHIEVEPLASGGVVQASSDLIPVQLSAPVSGRLIHTFNVDAQSAKSGSDIAKAVQRAIRRNS